MSDVNSKVVAPSVQSVRATELAASRVCIDNWLCMLPSTVATPDSVSPPPLCAIELFVVSQQPLLAIDREFSTRDTILLRAAVFGLLHVGRVHALDLETDAWRVPEKQKFSLSKRGGWRSAVCAAPLIKAPLLHELTQAPARRRQPSRGALPSPRRCAEQPRRQ
jgi:hypothetical protein